MSNLTNDDLMNEKTLKQMHLSGTLMACSVNSEDLSFPVSKQKQYNLKN